MLRVVLDTNAIISAVITKHGKAAQVIEYLWKNKYILVSSREILSEVAEVL